MPVIQPFSYAFSREETTRTPSPLQQSAMVGADVIVSSPPATPLVLARLSPSPRASPCSSPRPSPPVSPVMSPCPPVASTATAAGLVVSAPCSLSPSKPIPISSAPSTTTVTANVDSPGTATRPKPARGPFCEAAPILCSPESADPLRYCMLLEDRQRHHRSVPSPLPTVFPALSSSPVSTSSPITGVCTFAAPPAAIVLPPSSFQYLADERLSAPLPSSRASSTSPTRISSPLPRLDIARSAIRENETAILPSPILPFTTRNADSPRRRSSLLRIAHVVRSESCSPTLSPSSSESDLSSRPESPTSSLSENPSATRIGSDAVRNRFPVMTTSSPSKFVGSYEESLLSRRLSARRSKPITFNATIGVIGHGKCKPALKCPPHMAVSFAAHYYNFEDDDLLAGGSPVPASTYAPSPPSPTQASHPSVSSGLRPALGWFAAPGTASTNVSSHSPTLPASAPTWTPYVGVIDLSRLKASSASTESLPTTVDEPSVDSPKPNKEGVVGGYRIPPRGQLQIVIKNPHQSALKVFLVPYDLSKMPKGTKTAMRHKQYARPVDDQPQPPDSAVPPTPRKRSLSHRSLRYALHIPIVCTARGRHYLAGSGGLRVVFSGKSPESHERLDAVTELAGGFTTWVPSVPVGKSAKSKGAVQAQDVDLAVAVPEEPPAPSILFTSESPVHNSSPPFIR